MFIHTKHCEHNRLSKWIANPLLNDFINGEPCQNILSGAQTQTVESTLRVEVEDHFKPNIRSNCL